MLTVNIFSFNPFQENTYLLSHENGQCIIIDPGCYYDHEKDQLAAFIEERKLRPELLLNTHCHLDHVFGNEFVANRYGLQLHRHEKETFLLESAVSTALMFDLPFASYNGPSVFLEDNELIEFHGDCLQVIFNPGHSPGSISFYDAQGGNLISGDALFQRSIGRTDLPGGDYDTLINSIKTRLFTLPEEVRVYSGHGPVTTVGEEKRENPFFR
jgi:hydroxyacylglutathione hydrolase